MHANRIFTIFSEFIFVISLILISCLSYTDILYRKDVCDENEFYAPYVRLLKTRQPHHEHSPILKSFKPGYVDVSKYTGILCVNGPAIVYMDINSSPKCTDNSTEWIPSLGEPQIFSHDCLSINRLPREEYKQPGKLKMTKDSQVFGNKVFGVYLLGKPPDYTQSNFAFFPQPDFGYRTGNSSCITDGAALAFLTNSLETSTYCYNIKKYNMDGIISVTYPGSPLFCYREDQGTDFDTPWHLDKNLVMDDINWTVCGSDNYPTVSKTYEPEPIQLPDFRMIHPKFWNSQGNPGIVWKAKRKSDDPNDTPIFSKPNPPGSLFPGEPGWKDPSEMINSNNENELLGLPTTTLEPYQKFFAEIPASECEEIPKPMENCTDDIQNACGIFNQILTLEETNWKTDKLKEGSWRRYILGLVNEIYGKACPQVSRFLAPALSRIFQHFLSQAIDTDATFEEKFKKPKKLEWLEMVMDLERCNNKTEMMKFFRKKDVTALKLKKKLETKLNKIQRRISARITAAMSASAGEAGSTALNSVTIMTDPSHMADIAEIEKIQNHLNEFPLKFPYKVLIGNADKPGYEEASRVYQYREAAEIDHELDWALDAYWKVISTVLGYCNIHYASRDASTFMRLYDSFAQDFLEYIIKDWTKGGNLRIYEQLFGEFIYGSGVLWIDACHDGAYQWSNTVDRRPLRPIPLHEGDLPPSIASSSSKDTTVPTNFFVDNPAYTTGIEDDDDYAHHGDDSEPETTNVPETGNSSNGSIALDTNHSNDMFFHDHSLDAENDIHH